MHDTWSIDLIWWITVVELPALGGLFLLLWRVRRDCEVSLRNFHDHLEAELSHLRENLSAYKLEVAKTYASLHHLKDVERRLTRHLVRIENKLDSTPFHINGGKS
ncbi:MAG: hypothetical protein OQK35_05630 [Alphaproteobacteria bacterium]|nr:hypothetical protein [Rhodospirillales bacterium]MCW9045795.1 hypothetical protein [Alphaproteobacteria bacterium]